MKYLNNFLLITCWNFNIFDYSGLLKIYKINFSYVYFFKFSC